MPDETSRVPQEVEPPTDLGTATPPDQLGNGPENDLFAPRDGETSTAGMNYGGSDGVGSGPENLPGGTFDNGLSGTGTDEGAFAPRPNVGTDSALGSDPGDGRTSYGGGVGADSSLGSDPTSVPASGFGDIPPDDGSGGDTSMRPVTVGGQDLLRENDNATTNSNTVGDDNVENTAAL